MPDMPDPTPPPSALVVISWWSNCLALDCLQRLRTHAPDRPLYVVQVGKSPEQCARFREQVPPEVRELSYPDDAPAEHSRVIQHTAFTHLRDTGGVWFIDHDVLFQAEAEPFFAAADRWFARDPALCLCVNSQSGSPALTQPAFWLSPSRWPESTPALDPVPFKPRSSARRPDLYHHEGEMSIPEQDTLVRARDELAAAGRAAAYTLDGSDDSDDSDDSDGSGLPPFPTHEHLGGLYLFAGSTPWLPGFEAWAWETVTRFNTYFVQCPPAWSAIEDPVLMERIALFTREMQQPDLTAGDPFAFEEFPREPLKFPVTRRQLFSSMRTNLEVASGKAEGGTALQLADLGSAPDSALAGLMPQVLPGCTITVEQNMVFGQAPDGPRPLPLFPLDSPALQVFNLFNGQTPLAEVSRQLADMHVWPRQRSFAYVRGVFLTLVLCGLCLPTG